MELLNQLAQSFLSQGLIGFGFLVITAGVGLSCWRSSTKISNEYSKLIHEFNSSERIDVNGNEELDIKNEVLNKIVEDFKQSASRGTENINTEVIIQRRLDENVSLFKKERLVKSIPAVCIALGLLGTFLGLTLAIVQTKGVLGDSLGSTQMFGKSMEGPFTSMSSAFWTSIFGVIGSVLLNYHNVKLENNKEEFYDGIEDYLDNNIYSLYAVNFISQFNDFNTIISERMMELNSIVADNMISLTGEMRSLFQDGVSELVGNINQNTLDLTDTVNSLTNYTKDLERLTSSLDTSVKNFKDPVDKFKSTMHEFIQTSEDTTISMKESVNRFAVKVDVLEESLNGVYSVIKSNKDELEKIGNSVNDSLGDGIKAIYNSHDRFIELTDKIGTQQDSSQKEIKEQINNLNKGYKSFNDLLLGFVDNLSATQSDLSDKIAITLTNEFKNISSNIVESLNTSISKLGQSAEELKSNTNDIGELVKQTNDLHNSININTIEKEPIIG